MTALPGARITGDPRTGVLLVLEGDLLGDPYHVASLALAFTRRSALDRERCWALAIGVAALGASAASDASIVLERTADDPLSVVARFCGAFCVSGAVEAEQALTRLHGLGFCVSTRGEGSDRVLEVRRVVGPQLAEQTAFTLDDMLE